MHTLGFEVHLRHRVELGAHVSAGTQVWAQVNVSTARRELPGGECAEGGQRPAWARARNPPCRWESGGVGYHEGRWATLVATLGSHRADRKEAGLWKGSCRVAEPPLFSKSGQRVLF